LYFVQFWKVVFAATGCATLTVTGLPVTRRFHCATSPQLNATAAVALSSRSANGENHVIAPPCQNSTNDLSCCFVDHRPILQVCCPSITFPNRRALFFWAALWDFLLHQLLPPAIQYSGRQLFCSKRNLPELINKVSFLGPADIHLPKLT